MAIDARRERIEVCDDKGKHNYTCWASRNELSAGNVEEGDGFVTQVSSVSFQIPYAPWVELVNKNWQVLQQPQNRYFRVRDVEFIDHNYEARLIVERRR